MSTENLRKWAEGKPIFVVHVGQLLAVAASEIFQAIEWGRSGEFGRRLGDPPAVDQWLSLYRDHRRIQRVILEAFPLNILGLPLTTENAEPLRSGMAELGRMNRDDLEAFIKQIPPEELGKIMAEVQNIMGNPGENHFAEVERWRSGNIFSDDVLSRAVALPEVHFVVRVLWPCWLEYGHSAAKLLFRARHTGQKGKEFDKEQPWQALDQLARLDKTVLNQKRIKEAFNKAAVDKNIHFEDVSKAIGGSPNRKITISNLKAALAAYIQLSSEVLNHPLTAPEIRRLFDAVAQDSGNGLRDVDLPELDNTWAQAVLRARPFWGPFFRRDKKR